MGTAAARGVIVVTLTVLASGLGASGTAPTPAGGGDGGRAAFVIGAPGRLAAPGDRRLPRRYERDAPGAAYVDVEEVADPTWLTQELERYVRAYDCDGVAATWCRREVRAFADGAAIYVAVGERAELVWRSGENRAVRLAWRRIVVTPTGTMTRETPPPEFARAVGLDFPSRLAPLEIDGPHADDFADREIDRLVYYIDRALEASSQADAAAPRRGAERFVAASLRHIDRLRATVPTGSALPPFEFDGGAAIPSASEDELAQRLTALRQWWSEAGARLTPADPRPWCPVERPLRVAPGALAGEPR